jgi:serine/threonine protein kinase
MTTEASASVQTSARFNYLWTTGDDPAISHVHKIDEGTYGEVHKVFSLYTNCFKYVIDEKQPNRYCTSQLHCYMIPADFDQVFARKIIRIFGRVTEEDVLKEVRAVERLCTPGTHKNIVCVFYQGWLSSSLYFLDMEYCELDLDGWIQRHWSPEVEQKLPHLTGNVPSRTKMTQIWDVMEDLTKGVAFIHSKSQVHRDLKPRNSNSFSNTSKADTSPLLWGIPGLENCRLWTHIRRDVQTSAHYSLCARHFVLPLT